MVEGEAKIDRKSSKPQSRDYDVMRQAVMYGLVYRIKLGA
jgi:hypothetical protein